MYKILTSQFYCIVYFYSLLDIMQQNVYPLGHLSYISYYGTFIHLRYFLTCLCFEANCDCYLIRSTSFPSCSYQLSQKFTFYRISSFLPFLCWHNPYILTPSASPLTTVAHPASHHFLSSSTIFYLVNYKRGLRGVHYC